MNPSFLKWLIENCYIIHDPDYSNSSIYTASLHFTMVPYHPNLLLFNREGRIGLVDSKYAEKASKYRLPNLPLHLRTKYLAS